MRITHLLILTALLLISSDAFAQQNTSESQRLDYSAFDIAYLLDADDAGSDHIEELESNLGAVPVHNWDDLLMFDFLLGVDAVIVHSSALSFVDTDWMIEAYNRGIVIAGLDLTATQFVQITGNGDFIEAYEMGFKASDDLLTIVTASYMNFQELADNQGFPTGGQDNHLINASGYSALNFSDIQERNASYVDIVNSLNSIRQQKQIFFHEAYSAGAGQ